MSKKKHKKKKPAIDWQTLIASSIADLIIGIALLIIEHFFF